MPAINQTAALAALDGNSQLLSELSQIFLEDAPALIAELRTAIDSGEDAKARRIVHSLKGLVSTFYAADATEVAQRLESDIKAGDLSTLKDGGYEELSCHIEAVLSDLRSLVGI